MIIPYWLKIAGPIVILALLIVGVMAWGNSKYGAGEKAGIEATDAKWEAASAKLRKEAAASATRADDAAVIRLEKHVEQAKEDQEKVDAAVKEGSSPLDALFGG